MNTSQKTWAIRILLAFAGLIALVPLFYAEEDLRGALDWSNYQHQEMAKGQKFEWNALVPAPVPDDQNFAMSSVWVASIKYYLGTDPHKMAVAWYGDRVNDADVSKFLDLMPVTPSALAGPDFTQDRAAKLPPTPQTWTSWPTGHRLDLKPWQSYYRDLKQLYPADVSLSSQPQSPATDVLLALSKYDPVIARLQQDSQRPSSRFPVQYNSDDPGGIWLPHLAAVKQCAEVLELRTVAELQNGKTDQAADDIKLILRLVDSVRTEPFIITHLVRFVVMQMAIQPIYEGLADHQWTDAQLVGFDSELAKVDFPADYEFSIQGECAAHVQELKWLGQKRSRFLDYFGNGQNNNQALKAAVLEFYLAPKGWLYQADILAARHYQNWAGVVTDDDNGQPVVSPDKVSQAGHAYKAMLKATAPYDIWEGMMTADLTGFARRTAYAQESVDLARVAIALERCYLALGAYPNSLDALAPRFMQQVPPDVIDGQPLHYRLTSDRQFVLYSVGWNGRDDGGHSYAGNSGGNGNLDQGDWVWQYPKQ